MYKSKTGLKSKIKRRRRDGTSTASSRASQLTRSTDGSRPATVKCRVSRHGFTESIEATRMAPAAAAVTGIPIIFQPWTLKSLLQSPTRRSSSARASTWC